MTAVTGRMAVRERHIRREDDGADTTQHGVSLRLRVGTRSGAWPYKLAKWAG